MKDKMSFVILITIVIIVAAAIYSSNLQRKETNSKLTVFDKACTKYGSVPELTLEDMICMGWDCMYKITKDECEKIDFVIVDGNYDMRLGKDGVPDCIWVSIGQSSYGCRLNRTY